MVGILATSTFERGSTLHVVTVAACFAAAAAAAWLGRRCLDASRERERRLRVAWVVSVVVFQVASQVWQNLPGNFDLQRTLPLHLCDLVVWTVPFALMTRWRLSRTLLYFWGAGLTIFAFLLPTLRDGPDHIVFWLFWIGHTQILGSAVYVVAVQRYTPSLHDVGVAFLANVVYVMLILPFDIALDLDYGYVGPGRSPTAVLGPWPVRVPVMLGLEGLLFVLLWIPWRVASKRGSRSA